MPQKPARKPEESSESDNSSSAPQTTDPPQPSELLDAITLQQNLLHHISTISNRLQSIELRLLKVESTVDTIQQPALQADIKPENLERNEPLVHPIAEEFQENKPLVFPQSKPIKYPDFPRFEPSEEEPPADDPYLHWFADMQAHLKMIDSRLLSYPQLQPMLEVPGQNSIINQKLWLSMPDPVCASMLNYRTEKEIRLASFNDLKTWILRTVAFLEFRDNLGAYLRKHPQKYEPLHSWHMRLRALSKAFPELLSTTPNSVVMHVIFEAYQTTFQHAYIKRFGPFTGSINLLQLMKYMDQESEKIKATRDLEQAIEYQRRYPAPYVSPNSGEQPPPVVMALMEDADPSEAIPDALNLKLMLPTTEHNLDRWKPIYARGFEHGEYEAYQDLPPKEDCHFAFPYLCAVVRELNHSEPTCADPKVIDTLLTQLRHMVFAVSRYCPGFSNQLHQLLDNRIQTFEDTKQNTCWNCGKPGHIKAHCPDKIRKFATDYRRR